jgi:hypothetical protein
MAAIPAMTNNACQITVVFAPTATGNESATLNITANPGSTQLALSGLGTEPKIAITPSPQPYYVAPGGAAQTQAFTVTNNGTGSTGTLTVSTPGAPFSVVADGCSGKTWGAGATCQFSVQYAPPGGEASGMMDSAMVTVSDSYNFVPDNASINVKGTAEAPVTLTMTPMAPVYPVTNTVTFTVTNTGPLPSGALATPTWTATDITTPADLHADFALMNDNCTGATLSQSKPSCTYDLVFMPPAPSLEGGVDQFSGTTSVKDDSGNTAGDTFTGSFVN